MNLSTKKIFAREGLILIGIIGGGLIITWLVSESIGIFVLIFIYPVYLLFRFILWAIKVLIQKG